MSLKQALEARGINRKNLEIAIANTEKVLATVILNASKNVTNAQAMKGNTSVLSADLEVLKAVLDEFIEADKTAAKKPRTVKVEDNDVSPAVEG